MDDGSLDNTARIIDDWIANCPRKNFHLTSMKVNSGRAAACNAGIRAATSPYILFTDDDCLPDPDWAEYHLNLQKASSVPIGVIGAVNFPESWVKKSNFVRYFLMLSKALPISWNLVVKDHPNMAGRRSWSFIREIKSFLVGYTMLWFGRSMARS